jgi:hypothetical protein
VPLPVSEKHSAIGGAADEQATCAAESVKVRLILLLIGWRRGCGR